MPDQLTAPPPPPLETEDGARSARRARRTVAAQSVAALLLAAVLGVAGGWAVERLWGPPQTGMVVNHHWYRGVVSLDPPVIAQNADQAVFAGMGWYVVVSVVIGLLVGGLAAVFWARQELATLVSVVVATLAAGLLVYAVATALAPADPARAAASAANGTVLRDTLHLGSHWIVLACPAGGLVALVVVFLTMRPRRSRGRVRTSQTRG